MSGVLSRVRERLAALGAERRIRVDRDMLKDGDYARAIRQSQEAVGLLLERRRGSWA